MDENEFEFDGNKYVAEESSVRCEGYQFNGEGGDCEAWSDEIPCCAKTSRMDGRDVIFVEKQR